MGSREVRTISFAYDTLNRLKTKTPPSPAVAVNYSYDLNNRLTNVGDTQRRDRRRRAAVRSFRSNMRAAPPMMSRPPQEQNRQRHHDGVGHRRRQPRGAGI